ncbi:GD1L1 protein, partial [Leiothrix lutea]|nr:GD1L1 protein [Leiothrix lutea]
MATPNNVTPTNCSWWPISALENNAGKSTEGEENHDPTDPALKSQDRLVLYHWTQSFSSQKVRLVIAEKGLPCEERDVSMPLMEHKEPWFMRLNLGEEVPVIIHRDNIISDYNQIIDYMEKNFTGGNARLGCASEEIRVWSRFCLLNKSTFSFKVSSSSQKVSKSPAHPRLLCFPMKLKTASVLLPSPGGGSTHKVPTAPKRRGGQHPHKSLVTENMGGLIRHRQSVHWGSGGDRTRQAAKQLQMRGGQRGGLWLCGCVFTLAEGGLGATLHRLKFLGLSKKYWEDGSRPNLRGGFDRIQKRFAFRKVLGDIHTTLLSAVVPNAFRLVKRKPPSFLGASFLMGSLGGMGYFAYWYLKKKYI